MRDLLIEDLKADEGWVPHAYQDHLGFWTIGYGFLIDQRRGGGIPQEVAEVWLEYVLDQKEDELYRRAPWVLGQPPDVQRGLLNMAYQLGVSGLLNFRNMCAALQARDREAAARHALDSRWARQTPNRARRVALLLRGKP